MLFRSQPGIWAKFDSDLRSQPICAFLLTIFSVHFQLLCVVRPLKLQSRWFSYHYRWGFRSHLQQEATNRASLPDVDASLPKSLLSFFLPLFMFQCFQMVALDHRVWMLLLLAKWISCPIVLTFPCSFLPEPPRVHLGFYFFSVSFFSISLSKTLFGIFFSPFSFFCKYVSLFYPRFKSISLQR